MPRYFWSMALAAGTLLGLPNMSWADTRQAPHLTLAEPAQKLLREGLVASGYQKGPAFSQAQETIALWIKGYLLAQGPSSEKEIAARNLLSYMHSKKGLLKKYDARATTLKDILEEGRFNCVSASYLFNLTAAAGGLEVSAELLPTHARSLIRLPRKGKLSRIVVETTSPYGFEPKKEDQEEILRKVAGTMSEGRSIVAKNGMEVSSDTLVAAIYVNRASIAQEADQLSEATRLFAKAEKVVSEPKMRQVLRDQRAALLAQLAVDDILSGEKKRLIRAHQSLLSAAALKPAFTPIRQTVEVNLRAVTERLVHVYADLDNEKKVLQVARASEAHLSSKLKSGLIAFALSEVARVRVHQGRLDEAVAIMERALKEQLGPGDQSLKDTLQQNKVSSLRMAAMRTAKKGKHQPALAYLGRALAVEPMAAKLRDELKEDQLRVIHLAGDTLLAQKKYSAAVEVYREGFRRFSQDATIRNNLLAVLERLALPLARSGRCDKLKAYIEEMRLIEAKNNFSAQIETQCLMQRASERLNSRDYAEAVALLEQSLAGAPENPQVKHNLGIAYRAWLQALGKKKDCRALHKQGQRFSEVASAQDKKWLRRILKKCRS